MRKGITILLLFSIAITLSLPIHPVIALSAQDQLCILAGKQVGCVSTESDLRDSVSDGFNLLPDVNMERASCRDNVNAWKMAGWYLDEEKYLSDLKECDKIETDSSNKLEYNERSTLLNLASKTKELTISKIAFIDDCKNKIMVEKNKFWNRITKKYENDLNMYGSEVCGKQIYEINGKSESSIYTDGTLNFESSSIGDVTIYLQIKTSSEDKIVSDIYATIEGKEYKIASDTLLSANLLLEEKAKNDINLAITKKYEEVIHEPPEPVSSFSAFFIKKNIGFGGEEHGSVWGQDFGYYNGRWYKAAQVFDPPEGKNNPTILESTKYLIVKTDVKGNKLFGEIKGDGRWYEVNTEIKDGRLSIKR